MTKEEVIKIIENIPTLRYEMNLEHSVHGDLANALYMAILALREQKEREAGCEYCNDNFEFWSSEISGYFNETDIKYCIHCGRKLNKEAENNDKRSSN